MGAVDKLEGEKLFEESRQFAKDVAEWAADYVGAERHGTLMVFSGWQSNVIACGLTMALAEKFAVGVADGSFSFAEAIISHNELLHDSMRQMIEALKSDPRFGGGPPN